MKSRPIAILSIYFLIALMGYMIADLSIQSSRDRFLPEKAPQARVSMPRMAMRPDRGSYNGITSRNMFNSDQKIGDPFGADPAGQAPVDAAPIASTLPLELVGTIVHVNPQRSVVTINLKTKNEQVSLRVGAIIPENLGTVTLIERSKVTFRNATTQHLEYIEIKDDSKLSFSGPKPVQNGEVTKVSDTQFEIPRTDINRLTGDMQSILQQARAVPRMGPNGQIECFSLADISPGSIYERLGLKKGDCIKSVEGEKIDSPAKAFELYNRLRGNSSSISLVIERSGTDTNMNYNITN
jgi:general secretion pathway protein C